MSKQFLYRIVESRVVQFVVVSFVGLIILLVSYSSASAALQSVPSEKQPTQQENKYDTNLFTGSSGYTYDFVLPPATNGLQPSLGLTYNSLGTNNVSSRVGMGWQINQDFVETDTNFTPTDFGDDKYKLHFQGTTYDLIYDSTDDVYHTKIESFLRIKKIGSAAQNNSGTYWELTAKDGTKYRFGYQQGSELVCDQPSFVRYWSLDLVTDTHGNSIFYTYLEDNGAAYLDKIEYNNDKQRVVDLSYESNPYQHTVHTNGCRNLENYRLKTVSVTANNSSVRSYDLVFSQSANGQNLLTSITEKGSDGSPLPPTTFTYFPQIKNWDTQHNDWISNVDIDAHLQQTNTRLADVTGDGMPDIVKGIQVNGGIVTWKVWRSLGNSWSTQAELWLNNADIDAYLDQPQILIVDVTGDGLADIVKSIQVDGGRVTWRVWRNTGTSWNTQHETWINNADIDAHLLQNNTRLADVTGDGLPDIVKGIQVNGGIVTWKVWRNTGSSWNTQAEIWINNADIDVYLDQAQVKIADVNGDGLADIVKSIQVNGGIVTWRVWRNTGASWSTQAENWINNADIDAHLLQEDVDLADVNGDHLPDIVKGIQVDGSTVTWRVWLNKGNSWNTQFDNWLDRAQIDAYLYQSEVRLADANGDGLADIVKSIQVDGGRVTWRVWPNKGYAPNYLLKLNTSQGGEVSFSYLPAASFDNTGPDAVSDLPFAMWIVSSMTTNNGVSGDQAVTTIADFGYQDGMYASADREFRGFGQVTKTTSAGTRTIYNFHQNTYLKGKAHKIEMQNIGGSPFATTEQTWTTSTGNLWSSVLLTQTKQYTFDGVAEAPKVTETNYEYDNFGNITKIAQLGDASTQGDEKFEYSEYVYNTPSWVVDKPKHAFTNKSDDTTKAQESWFYYDNHAGLDEAPVKGDLTREEKWLNTGTNPVALYEYDSYGNKTKETDANGNITQYIFGVTDSTHTFPEQKINAKNQQSDTRYDLGTGNTLSQADPNGFTTSYQYDVFGRISKEIKPYDTGESPTVSYQYFDDGIAPEGTLVAKREVSGTPNTLDTYIFVDGFGRVGQTRSDAEDVSKQVVTNTFYNNMGLVDKQTIPHLDTYSTNYAAPVAGTAYTQTSYDTLGRAVSVTDPGGRTKTISYDHWSQTHTNENGNQTIKRYDWRDNTITIEEIDSSSSYITSYLYDTLDNLVKIADASGNNFLFEYDTLGRKTKEIDPDIGTWNYGFDDVGNLASQTDNKGVTITKTYDQLNRITNIDYPSDTDVVYTWDTGKIGTLAQVTDAAGTVEYEYDNRLRKTNETRTFDGNTWETQFNYDALDRLTSQTNPDGEVLTYNFNNQGEVDSLNGLVGNVNYNAAGKITKKEFGNLVSTDYTYNSDDLRLTKISTTDFQNLDYTYDNIGNIKSITNNFTGSSQNFDYDKMERLVSANETNGFSHSYSYDPIGNLTSFSDGSNVVDYTHGQGAGPHVLTSSTENVPTPTPSPSPSPTPTPTPDTAFTGEYFDNRTLSGSPKLVRQDTAINFDWGGSSPDPTIPADNFSVRWTKQESFENGSYKFTATADDGLRVYVDGVLIIDKWIDQGATTYTATKQMTAGVHEVKMEYYENGGGAVASLSYANTTPTPTPTPDPNSFRGEYYSNQTLSGEPALVRYDSQINFSWGTSAPDPLIPVDHFSVVWTKDQYFDEGSYEFTATTDDGVKLFIDSELVIDKWIDQGPTSYSVTRNLSSGDHTIKMEYYENYVGAVAKLSWQAVSNPTPTPSPTPQPGGNFIGEYFDNQSLSGTPKLVREDTQINFDWGGSSPDPTIPVDRFSARWTKTESFEEGTYEFTATGDDGIRLYVDGVKILDKWIDQGATTYKVTRDLSQGNHTVVFEYYENGGGAVAKMSYAKISATPTPTPTIPTDAYHGEYYSNRFLSGTPQMARQDSSINFDWGNGSPDPSISLDNFSARWTRQVSFEDADYKFTATADDGVRVFVDDNLVIDKWIDQPSTTYTATRSMTSGNHIVKVEYYENGGGAVAKFSYELVSTPNPTPTPNPEPSPTPSPTVGTELLSQPWDLVGNAGAVEKYQSISSSALQGKTTMRITYNLHGLNALGGDASAIIFDQNGWKYISLSNYGQNGLDGWQTIDIPLSDFPGLDPNASVGTLHTRFWYSGSFHVEISSIQVL